MNVEALFAQLRKDSTVETAEAEVEKTASAEEVQQDENLEKLASELYAGGQLFAEGFVDRMIEKLAGSGVPAGGGGKDRKSKWQAVANKIDALHSATTVGDNSSVRAEAEALSGNKGVANKAKPLA